MSDGDLHVMAWTTNGQPQVRVRVEPSEEWRELEILPDPEDQPLKEEQP